MIIFFVLFLLYFLEVNLVLVRQRIQRKLFNTWPLLLRLQRPQEVQSLQCKCRYVWVKWLEVNTEQSKVFLREG